MRTHSQRPTNRNIPIHQRISHTGSPLMQILSKLEKSHASVYHHGAASKVEIADSIHGFRLDYYCAGVVRTHGIVPHVPLSAGAHGRVVYGGGFDDGDHFIHGGGVVDCCDIVASREAGAVECVV